VADLRGKTDSECIEAMLSIADARFIDALCAEAKAHGKLAADFQIPERWRNNRPEHLKEILAPWKAKGQLSPFPFGSDFTEVEQRLLPALEWLKNRNVTWRGKAEVLRAALTPGDAVSGEGEALERMALARPSGVGERVQQRLLKTALRRVAGGEAGGVSASATTGPARATRGDS
jgi:hypothetical protein